MFTQFPKFDLGASLGFLESIGSRIAAGVESLRSQPLPTVGSQTEQSVTSLIQTHGSIISLGALAGMIGTLVVFTMLFHDSGFGKVARYGVAFVTVGGAAVLLIKPTGLTQYMSTGWSSQLGYMTALSSLLLFVTTSVRAFKTLFVLVFWGGLSLLSAQYALSNAKAQPLSQQLSQPISSVVSGISAIASSGALNPMGESYGEASNYLNSLNFNAGLKDSAVESGAVVLSKRTMDKLR